MYDLIGNIHGHSAELHALLAELGYRQEDGAFRHPDRKAIFLGDFIDRGSGSMAVIETVRTMVEAGSALAVMGNHEFNALAYHTPHPEKPGEYLRPRTPKNTTQHQATLDALDGQPPDSDAGVVLRPAAVAGPRRTPGGRMPAGMSLPCRS